MRTSTTTTGVAADMERIFGPLAARAPARLPRHDAVVPAPPRPEGRDWRPLTFAAPALVVGVAAALAIGYGRAGAPAPRTAGAEARVAPAPVLPSAAPSPTRPVAVVTAVPAPAPAVATPGSAAPVAVAEAGGAPAVPASVGPRCEPGGCTYRDVLAADARLRLAYDRARRGGVEPARLAAAVGRWRRAREDAPEDPERAVRRYGRLADALDEALRGMGR